MTRDTCPLGAGQTGVAEVEVGCVYLPLCSGAVLGAAYPDAQTRRGCCLHSSAFAPQCEIMLANNNGGL